MCSLIRRFQNNVDEHSIELLKLSCQGWRARFELHPLGDETASLADFQIQLDQHEVWLHVRQSLHFSGQALEMALPLAISRDLGMFTIMRYLFSWKPATAFKGASFESLFIPLSCKSCDKVGHNCPFQETQAADYNNLCGRPVQLSRARYKYAMTFSQNSRYLVFSDHVDSKRSKVASNLVVLEIRTHDRLHLSFVQSQKMPFHKARTQPVTDFVFHPRKGFLLYFHRNAEQDDRSILGPIEGESLEPDIHINSVYMWIFMRKKPADSKLLLKNANHITSNDDELPFSDRADVFSIWD